MSDKELYKKRRADKDLFSTQKAIREKQYVSSSKTKRRVRINQRFKNLQGASY